MSCTKMDGRGALTVCVRFRSEVTPVPGASVRVYGYGESLTEKEPLLSVKTDSSGHTPAIELPAPPPEGEAPYALYDVWVTADRMEPCVIRGVQIFGGAHCIQPLDLFPIKEALKARGGGEPFGDGMFELIETAPHSLWEGFSTGSGFVSAGGVIGEVSVPEYVVVHDGAPGNANVPDYWLPYREYIKMAASHTLSPQWPENALRAGVLAIVSLTLARAAAKPYEPEIYTLTSSPEHDLPFSYGRGIYKEISLIADGVFNNYIARPYEELPLASGLTDGALSKGGGGLPLWRAAELAEKGYSTVNILRHFFGQTIYLETARIAPRGVRALRTEAYPGRPLRVDESSSGQYIKIAQKLLNSVAGEYPAIKRIKADGVFGQKTRAAVLAFQKAFFLDEDGIIGKATWYRLWEAGGRGLGRGD